MMVRIIMILTISIKIAEFQDLQKSNFYDPFTITFVLTIEVCDGE